MAQPVAQNITAIIRYASLVDSQEEKPPTTQIVLRKDTGSNTLYLDTNAGEEEIIVSGGSATFNRVTVTGDNVELLVVRRADDSGDLLVVDSKQPSIAVNGDLNISGDFKISGALTSVIADELKYADPIIKLSDGQLITDVYNQGIYSTYSPNSVDVRYRGCIYDRNEEAFVMFQNSSDNPANNDLPPFDGQFTAQQIRTSSASGLRFGSIDYVDWHATVHVGQQLTYTVPNVGQSSTFALTAAAQTFAGAKTFTALSTSRPIGGVAYDVQMFSFLSWLNPTNLNQAIGPQQMVMLCAQRIQDTALTGSMPYIQFGNGTAGVIEFGSIPVKLNAGQYLVCFTYIYSPNRSICELYCTALGLSIVFDAYVASISSDTPDQRVSFAVPTAGVYNFALRQNGKNASSTGYIMQFYPIIHFIQTS